MTLMEKLREKKGDVKAQGECTLDLDVQEATHSSLMMKINRLSLPFSLSLSFSLSPQSHFVKIVKDVATL